MDIEKCYKIKEAAEIFSVSTRTVYRWIKKKKLGIVRVNGLPRIKASEIERIMKG